MQCKCYVCSYQHMENSSLAFWSFLEFFSLVFSILSSLALRMQSCVSLFRCFSLELLGHVEENYLLRLSTGLWRDHLIVGHRLSDGVYKACAESGLDKSDVLSLDFSHPSEIKVSVLYCILGFAFSLPPSPDSTLCLIEECLHHKQGRLCLLFFKSDYVLLSKWCRAGPTIHFSTR